MDVEMETVVPDDKTDSAWMRERFIMMQVNLRGLPAHIVLHDNTTVDGKVQTIDGNFQNIIVNDLHTPTQEIIPKAVLRMSDIISIRISH